MKKVKDLLLGNDFRQTVKLDHLPQTRGERVLGRCPENNLFGTEKMNLSKILTGIGRSFQMNFEALYWIMFEIWRLAQKRYTWLGSNLPVGEKYKIPLSVYNWVHWVNTKSDRDLALHGKTWISSMMQSTDNNLAHSSSPGAQEKRDLDNEPWSLINKKLWRRKRRWTILKGRGRKTPELRSGQLLVLTTVLELKAIGGKTYGRDL